MKAVHYPGFQRTFFSYRYWCFAAKPRQRGQRALHKTAGTEKLATKNVRLFLYHCCKTRWIVILRVLPPMFKPVNNLICCKTGFMWVVKRATSVFNSFCSNVAEQVARFLLPVFLYLWERTYGTRVAVHWPRTFDRPHQNNSPSGGS